MPPSVGTWALLGRHTSDERDQEQTLHPSLVVASQCSSLDGLEHDLQMSQGQGTESLSQFWVLTQRRILGQSRCSFLSGTEVHVALGLSFTDAPRALNIPGSGIWGLDSCRVSNGWLRLYECVPGLLPGPRQEPVCLAGPGACWELK